MESIRAEIVTRWKVHCIFDLQSQNLGKKLRVASLNGNSFGKFEYDLEFNLIGQILWSPDSKSLTVTSSRGGPKTSGESHLRVVTGLR